MYGTDCSLHSGCSNVSWQVERDGKEDISDEGMVEFSMIEKVFSSLDIQLVFHFVGFQSSC